MRHFTAEPFGKSVPNTISEPENTCIYVTRGPNAFEIPVRHQLVAYKPLDRLTETDTSMYTMSFWKDKHIFEMES